MDEKDMDRGGEDSSHSVQLNSTRPHSVNSRGSNAGGANAGGPNAGGSGSRSPHSKPYDIGHSNVGQPNQGPASADTTQRSIIRAASSKPAYVPLTPLDVYLGHYVTGGAYFFLRSPDIARMEGALAVALDRHPTFGACMVREAGRIGLSCGSTGAEFSVHRSDAAFPDLRATEGLITDALLALQSSSGENDPDSENYGYDTESYRFNSGWPVARFRLVLFGNDRCALLLHHVHSQADGAAAMQFLQNWSRAYRGLALSLPSGYSRMQIAGLATLPGAAPSSRLNILRHAALHMQDSTQHRDGGSIRVDLPCAAIDHFVNDCRRRCRLSLSSSDVLHALAWHCFAAALNDSDQTIDEEPDPKGAQRRGPKSPGTTPRPMRLYTLFDLRGIKPLGIPTDYDGSAVLGRCAEMDYSELLKSSIPALALAFQQQIKPFTADEAQRDISYLAREYHEGHIDEAGNYANFVIGAWLDCRTDAGLIVNDLRRLTAADICFEERPARMETMVSPDINMVSIYQNDDGTVTLHYVGERTTLPIFARHLKSTIAAGANLTTPAG